MRNTFLSHSSCPSPALPHAPSSRNATILSDQRCPSSRTRNAIECMPKTAAREQQPTHGGGGNVKTGSTFGSRGRRAPCQMMSRAGYSRRCVAGCQPSLPVLLSFGRAPCYTLDSSRNSCRFRICGGDDLIREFHFWRRALRSIMASTILADDGFSNHYSSAILRGRLLAGQGAENDCSHNCSRGHIWISAWRRRWLDPVA